MGADCSSHYCPLIRTAHLEDYNGHGMIMKEFIPFKKCGVNFKELNRRGRVIQTRLYQGDGCVEDNVKASL
jgi:hypothetical protein